MLVNTKNTVLTKCLIQFFYSFNSFFFISFGLVSGQKNKEYILNYPIIRFFPDSRLPMQLPLQETDKKMFLNQNKGNK